MNKNAAIAWIVTSFVAGAGITSAVFVMRPAPAPATPTPATHVVVSPKPQEPVAKSLPEEYFASKFRVLATYESSNPPYFLTVATERDAQNNDSACGSMYTTPTCYFFLERAYDVASPPQKLIAAVEGKGALQTKSVKFVDADTIEFKTADGDGGQGFEAVWHLTVSTGALKEVSRKTYGPD